MKTHLLSLARFCLTGLVALIATAASAEVFLHVVAPANRQGGQTVLDHPALNGQPEALVFATQRFGDYNPHEIGVSYDETRGRWLLRNEDRAELKDGLRFNVLALPPGLGSAYAHTTTVANTKEYYTFLNHPAADLNPDALILVTPHNAEPRGLGPLGVWYNGSQWSIYRQDKKPLEPGLRFNVLINDPLVAGAAGKSPLGLRRALLHRATPDNSRGYQTSTGLTDSADFVFTLHNWRDAGPYNFHVVGIWHSGTEWVLLNQDRGEIEKDAKFNVFVFSPPQAVPVVPAPPVAPPPPVAVDRSMGWIEVSNSESDPVSFSFAYKLDGETKIFSTGPLPPGATFRHEAPNRAREFRVRAETLNSPRRSLLAQNYDATPNKKITTRPTTLPPAAR